MNLKKSSDTKASPFLKALLPDIEIFIRKNFSIGEEQASPCFFGKGTIRQSFLSSGSFKKPELDDFVKNRDETFSEALMRLLREKNIEDTECYSRAGIDRRHFSKIRNPKYHPGKPTVISLAIAMKLTLDETQSFLSRAGYALAKNNYFDLIIEFFLLKGIYDFDVINSALEHFGQKTIGGQTE